MNFGSAQRVVAKLANQFVGQGHQVRILTLMVDDAYEHNNKIERLIFHIIYLLKSLVFNSLIHLFSIYKDKNNRQNIISAHTGKIGLSTIPIASLYKINIIISEHFNNFFQNKNFLRILSLFDYTSSLKHMNYFQKNGA